MHFDFSHFNIFTSIGMAFGSGSAIAHRAVDAVMGPRTIQHETVGSEAAAAPASAAPTMGGSDACGVHFKAFQDVSAVISSPFFLYLMLGVLTGTAD